MTQKIRCSCIQLHLLFGLIVALFTATSGYAESKPDQELEFDVAPNSDSQVYNRPSDAEYFWWDIEPPIKVELVFVDGSKRTVGSEEEFSKKIVSVRFINDRKMPSHVTLHSRF